jgi:peroxiredoxin
MALQAGDTAPDFKLPAVIGEKQQQFQLSSHKGKNVVLLFYVLDFTPVCAVELPPFQANLSKLSEHNAEVVGICTDTIFSHMEFQKSLGGLKYPLASDRWPYAEVAKAYGLFPATRHTFGGMNDRAVFIVDKNGKIAWSKVYDIAEAPAISEILDQLKKLA